MVARVVAARRARSDEPSCVGELEAAARAGLAPPTAGPGTSRTWADDPERLRGDVRRVRGAPPEPAASRARGSASSYSAVSDEHLGRRARAVARTVGRRRGRRVARRPPRAPAAPRRGDEPRPSASPRSAIARARAPGSSPASRSPTASVEELDREICAAAPARRRSPGLLVQVGAIGVVDGHLERLARGTSRPGSATRAALRAVAAARSAIRACARERVRLGTLARTPGTPRGSGRRARPPARRRRSTRSSGRRRGGARAGRGARASSTRPRGSAPGRTRTGPAPATAGRPRRGPGRCGRARRAARSSSPAGRRATALRAPDLNDWPSTAASWSSARSAASSASRRAAISAWSVAGHGELAELPDRLVAAALALAPGARRATSIRIGLDGVQRDALGAGDDRADGRPRAGPATSPLSSSRIDASSSGWRSRARNARLPAPQSGRRLEQLGPGERDDQDRDVAAPLEQVLDEVERARVRPVEVLEQERHDAAAGEPLEERPPRPEQLGRAARRAPPPTPRSASSAGSMRRRSACVGDVRRRATSAIRARVVAGVVASRAGPPASGPSRPAPRT